MPGRKTAVQHTKNNGLEKRPIFLIERTINENAIRKTITLSRHLDIGAGSRGGLKNFGSSRGCMINHISECNKLLASCRPIDGYMIRVSKLWETAFSRSGLLHYRSNGPSSLHGNAACIGQALNFSLGHNTENSASSQDEPGSSPPPLIMIVGTLRYIVAHQAVQPHRGPPKQASAYSGPVKRVAAPRSNLKSTTFSHRSPRVGIERQFIHTHVSTNT